MDGEAEAVAMGEWMQETVDGEAEAVAMGEWMQELWMVKLKR